MQFVSLCYKVSSFFEWTHQVGSSKHEKNEVETGESKRSQMKKVGTVSFTRI